MPSARGWFGGGLSRLEGRATHAPAHPAPLARGIANALPSLPSPPQGWRSRAAGRAAASPPKPRAFEMGAPRIWSARETSGKTPGEDLGEGRIWVGSMSEDLVCASRSRGRFWVKSEDLGRGGLFLGGRGEDLSLICHRK